MFRRKKKKPTPATEWNIYKTSHKLEYHRSVNPLEYMDTSRTRLDPVDSKLFYHLVSLGGLNEFKDYDGLHPTIDFPRMLKIGFNLLLGTRKLIFKETPIDPLAKEAMAKFLRTCEKEFEKQPKDHLMYHLAALDLLKHKKVTRQETAESMIFSMGERTNNVLYLKEFADNKKVTENTLQELSTLLRKR